ncbi:MAG: hypothetical protein IJO52_08365, partial [Clostridia bacterium]|nr:hypothetical protein [Clostridia bacterium]
MKKRSWGCLILALILTLGTVGCTDDTVHGDDAKQTESTDNKHEGSLTTSNLPENFVEFYHEAERAYALFTGYRSYSYTDSTFSENGADYRSVDVNGYTTLAELQSYCEQYFSSDLTDELMARTVSSGGQHPLFKEHKGKLYQFDGYAALFGYDVGSGYNMTLESFENDSYIVRIDATMTENNREIPATAYCTYTLTESGEIRFTSFELMAKKLFEALGQMPIDPEPFDAESFFAHIPAEWSQRLFWHQIRGSSDYMYFCNHRTINDSWTGFTKDPPKSFSVYHVDSENTNIIGNIGAELPSDLTYDTICPVTAIDGAGSMECEFIVQLTNGDKIFYVSFDNFDWGENQDHLTFIYRGILDDKRVNELKALYPDSFRKAEQYFWHYTLDDFANEKNGDNIVYEGYTVEYDIPNPDNKEQTFPFHIHLPQVNADSIYVDKWNLVLKQEYEMEFGDYLQSTAYGTNATVTASVRYETVTTGDIITIYIIKNYGILNSGAHTLSYDIYHYDTVEKKFLSTDQFLAYYAEGQFADYTVAQIVKFMNENVFTTDEIGSPYPITEENILGVIPSVFGNGKFDVVYMGYNLEGYHATRTLFSPYPTYTSDAVYTYRLTYHDCLTCHDKELYGSPVGYRLLLSKRVDGQYDVGYYVDCLFTEDIAERPESYPESVYGEYYTPVGDDEYGNMCMYIDHETDRGHLTAVIPYDMPESAQDYYHGIHHGYFDYERILDGNYQVNQNIASQVAEVLDAYRNGKDPNALLPDSKTEYTPYPLNTIRENPTANEIGEILKNTSMSEDGTIHFDLDLGSGWVMSLPIDIGGFGESVQAYFTGVWFAHGTPMEEEDIEWTQYSETDAQNGYALSFSIPESWNHNEGGILLGVLSDENGKKRIGERVFRGGLSIDEWKIELSEMANKSGLSKPFIGKTDSGLSYIGYSFKSGMQLGYMFERYLYRLEITEDLCLTIGIWDYSDIGISELDSTEFYNEYVLPILQSLTVGEIGDDVDTISDIADWDKLPWSESWEKWDRKPASNAYNFIYNLVSGESEIPEYNGLGIKEYSITLVEDEGSGIGTTFSFTFKVEGLSLPSTLIPAIYTWTIHDGMSLLVYTEGLPTNYEEGTAYENRMRGLHRFEGNS